MHRLQIFTDASVNTRLKVGYGAYPVLTDLDTSIVILKGKLKIKRFEQTSSTKSELQILFLQLMGFS
jgi:ribonuclease HI